MLGLASRGARRGEKNRQAQPSLGTSRPPVSSQVIGRLRLDPGSTGPRLRGARGSSFILVLFLARCWWSAGWAPGTLWTSAEAFGGTGCLYQGQGCEPTATGWNAATNLRLAAKDRTRVASPRGCFMTRVMLSNLLFGGGKSRVAFWISSPCRTFGAKHTIVG